MKPMNSSFSQSSTPKTITNLPGLLFIDHYAVSVLPGEMDNQVDFYKLMGFKEVHREEILGKDQEREVLLSVGSSNNLIQLVEPLHENSPVQRQIEKSGGRGSLIHIGFRVKDVNASFEWFDRQGFYIIDEAPRIGSRGTKVFFLHPQSHKEQSFGVLYEIVEDPKDIKSYGVSD